MVGVLRDHRTIDLRGALISPGAQATVPRIHLSCDDDLCVDEPSRALVVFRCVQEAITNAVKHARARNVWVAVGRIDAAIEDRRADDNRNVDAIDGAGLTGMRERVRELGGTVTIASGLRRGFRLHVPARLGSSVVIRWPSSTTRRSCGKGCVGSSTFSPDIRVEAEAADGDEAVRVILEHRPDVVLARRSHAEGEVASRCRAGAAGRRAAAILLTTFDDDVALLEGIRAGARGFLLKDVSLESLTTAIRQVAAGATLMRPAITERVVRRAERLAADFDSLDLPDRLTRREIEVLRLMAGGRTNREIAGGLGAARRSRTTGPSIFSKLGVRSRTQAVLKGIDLGYLKARRLNSVAGWPRVGDRLELPQRRPTLVVGRALHATRIDFVRRSAFDPAARPRSPWSPG
ncbi:MAG: LuxR C-terminal-related transcriptional regulator [Vicinamibacterales bacterium]